MIDWNSPIELSNGARAELISLPSDHDKAAYVRIFCGFAPDYPDPDPEGASWRYDSEGNWCGGEGNEYRIVNINRPEDNVPEEW